MSNLAERALDEAMALLAEVQFDSARGAYRQGELTAVSVMVDPESDPNACHIRVMCHDPGHLGINWGGLPLILIDRKTGEGPIKFLDRVGRARFTVTAAREAMFGFAFIDHGSIYSETVPAAVFAGHFATGVPRWKVQGQSRDRTLSAVAELLGLGQLRITVEAYSPEMRNSTVQVILRSAGDPSDVWLRKKLELDTDEGRRGSWSGRIGVGELRNRATDATLVVFACK
jgi:hypothetical protein